jgi:hypothetical protein
MEIGLLLLRLTAGLTLAAHGALKLFGWFGGPGLEATGLSGTFWGIAALFVGVLGGVFSLSQRHTTPGQQTTSAHTV